MIVSDQNATHSKGFPSFCIAAPGSTSSGVFTGTDGFNTTTPDVALSTDSVDIITKEQGFSYSNMQPCLALNFIICVNGSAPEK